ncbi:DMT family transporter [Paraburkholderia sp. UYCP14C]|uniref:DMT family transporter n=1 Tax=Paraburkholderia sp. UYCP14C TaxID=2511130 RepID=UPI0010202BA6|nr:DMT family transporter [Paraburkholderia sp. UYCP14C]RZF23504.1 DMT family transporter [Paraburkholderia sp. UYCP14C]
MNALELCVLAAIWGASFLFMRMGASEIGPVPLIALRVSIAAILLLPILRSKEARQQFRQHIGPLFIIGVTNSALPFCLLAYATLYVTAGVDSILNATTPMWAAAIAYFWLGVPVRKMQRTGLVIGFLGVVVLAWEAMGSGVAGSTGAVLAALLATISYGFAVNYSKRSLVGVKPFVSAFGTQLFASLVLAPFAYVFWPQHRIPMSTWYSVLALGALCTAVAYVLFFRLVANAGAPYAASVTFLIPVFGVIWGIIFLREPLTVWTIVGCSIVLLGTALASGKVTSLLIWRSPQNG